FCPPMLMAGLLAISWFSCVRRAPRQHQPRNKGRPRNFVATSPMRRLTGPPKYKVRIILKGAAQGLGRGVIGALNPFTILRSWDRVDENTASGEPYTVPEGVRGIFNVLVTLREEHENIRLRTSSLHFAHPVVVTALIGLTVKNIQVEKVDEFLSARVRAIEIAEFGRGHEALRRMQEAGADIDTFDPVG